MGYTHYFRIEKPLAKKTFKLLVADVRKLIKAAAKRKIYLADGAGTVGTVPVIKDDLISFNGMDYSDTGGQDGSHETLYIAQSGNDGFNFCKTARKPYDLVVVAVLIALKKHFPSVKLSSDGEREDWEAGIEFCQEVLEYGGNFDIDEGEFEEDVETMTKEEAITMLVDRELDTIRQEVIQDRDDYLKGIIRNGVTGFANLSNSDLEEEYYQATGERIRIKG